jgi:hypothetical protein
MSLVNISCISKVRIVHYKGRKIPVFNIRLLSMFRLPKKQLLLVLKSEEEKKTKYFF